MERVSFEEGIGTAPPPAPEGGAAAGPSLGRMSFEEGTGAKQTFGQWDRLQTGAKNLWDEGTAALGPVKSALETSVTGRSPLGRIFPVLRALETGGYGIADVAKAAPEVATGTLMQASDIFTGTLKSAVGLVPYVGGRVGAQLAGASQKDAAEAGAAAKEKWLPARVFAPYATMAQDLGPDAVKAYENNPIGWAMGKLSNAITSGAAAGETATGVPAEDFVQAIDSVMGVLGFRYLKPKVQATLRNRAAELKSFIKGNIPESMGGYTPVTPVTPGPIPGGPRLARPVAETFDAQGRIVPDAAFPEAVPLPTVPAAAKVPTAPAAAPSPMLLAVIAKQKAPSTLYVDSVGNVMNELGKPVAKRGDVSLATFKGLAAAGVVGAAIWATEPDPETSALIGAAGVLAISKGKGGDVKLTPPELVKEIAVGGARKEAALAKVFTDEYPQLVRSLRREHGDLAEDLAMRSIEKFLKTADAYEGRAAPQTYLQAIAKREATDSWRRAAIRREEPLVLESEIEGRGRDDASITKGIEDQSIQGQSPEQTLSNAQLGDKMAQLVDEMPAAYQSSWKKMRVDEMTHQEIADATGVPINTIRGQIHRGDQFMREGLRKYGPGLAAAGIVAGVAGELDEEQLAQLGLLAGAAGAVKFTKGGEWHPATRERLITALRGGLDSSTLRSRGATDVEIAAIFAGNPVLAWAPGAVNNWLNRYAGQASDPLKDGMMYHGEETWGQTTDKAFRASKPAEYVNQAGLGRVAPGADVWGLHSAVGHITPEARAVNALQTHLRHVSDYIAANVDPAKLGQYDLVRAVKETAAWDAKMAKEAEIARKSEGALELKRMETMPTPLRFEDGSRIVQLTRAGEFAHESTVMGHSVRGYEPPREGTHRAGQQIDDGTGGVVTQAHPDWIAASEKGLPEGQGGSGLATYGNGGWEAIKSGAAEVYSLRGKDGMSHVTFEVAENVYNNYIKRYAGVSFYKPPLNITQIKGQGNAAVSERYQQQVADFLNSREWGKVNLDQSGLIQTSKGVYVTLDAVAKASGVDKNSIKTYLEGRGTFNEADGAIIARALNSFEPPSKGTDEGGTPPPRGPGRGEAGRTSPEHAAMVAAGAGLVYAATQADPEDVAAAGTLAGAALMTKGPSKLRFISEGAGKIVGGLDYAVGNISTRLGNYSPALRRMGRDFEQAVLEKTKLAHDIVLPFIKELNRLKGVPRAALESALRLNDLGAITEAIKGNPAAVAGFRAVQNLLAKYEAELTALGRFKEGLTNYFPRIVADIKGFREALGKELREGLDRRLEEASTKAKRELTDVESSIIIDKWLQEKDTNVSGQPNFAKDRMKGELATLLEPYYASSTDSLLRYITAATHDIEIAKFFGKDLQQSKVRGKSYTNIEDSIGSLLQGMRKRGEIDSAGLEDIRSILKSRFVGGEKAMGGLMQDFRNINNITLLSSLESAATQIADPLMAFRHQGIFNSVEAIYQLATGKAKLTAKDLALVQHIAQEFGDGGRVSGKALGYVFGVAFRPIDVFGKNVNLVASRIKHQRALKTTAGREAFIEKYGAAYGAETAQLMAELSANKNTKLTKSLAFSNLSDIQPISKMEMSQHYLDNPNGRILHQMKTFLEKQIDVVRRESYQEIAKGLKDKDARRVAKGVKALATLAIAYSLSNIPGDVLKATISGQPFDLGNYDYVDSLLRNFGMGRYTRDMLEKGDVWATVRDTILPPGEHYEKAFKDPARFLAMVPIGGKALYNREFGGSADAWNAKTRQLIKDQAKAETKATPGLAKKKEDYTAAQREQLRQRARDEMANPALLTARLERLRLARAAKAAKATP